MGLETFTYITSFNQLWPLFNDKRHQGDDHLRGIKKAVQDSFPNVNGACTATPTQFNYLNVLTSAICELGGTVQTFSKGLGLNRTVSGAVNPTADFATENIFISTYSGAGPFTPTVNNPAAGRFMFFCIANSNASGYSITWTVGGGPTIYPTLYYNQCEGIPAITAFNLFFLVCRDASEVFIGRLTQNA